MQLTPDIYDEYAKYNEEFISEISDKAKKNIFAKIVLISVGCLMLILCFITGYVFLFVFLAFIFFFLGAYFHITGILSINKMKRDENRFVADSEMEKAFDAYKNNGITPKVIRMFNEKLLNENNIRRRAIYRYYIFRFYIYLGEYNTAYRYIYRDDKLFMKDAFFEELFFYELLIYHTSIRSTTGGTEYAEEAYKKVMAVFEKISKKNLRRCHVILAARAEIANSIYHKNQDNAYCWLKKMYDNYHNTDREYGELDYADDILLAELSYQMGDFETALALCDNAGPHLKGSVYYIRKANSLADILRKNIEYEKGMLS